MDKKIPKSREGDVIFVKRITLRNGKVIYASQYGLKAFAIKIRKK